MPSGFDKSYYLSAKLSALQVQYTEWQTQTVDVLENLMLDLGMTAEAHYSLHGYKEGLNPNAYFRQDEYRFAKAADMVDKGFSSSMEIALNTFDAAWTGDPYLHYLQFGAKEGINPSNTFDESQYLIDKLNSLKANPSTSMQWSGKAVTDLRQFLASVGITALDHLINFGASEGLSPSAVPLAEQHDPTYTPWELPHDLVTIPSTLSLDWVDSDDIITAPHKAIGQVVVTIDEISYLGTGFMISPEHLLTSAHVLLDDTGNVDSSSDITFSPGLNGDMNTATRYAWEEAWVEKTFDSTLYTEWPDDDLAIVKLDQPIGSTTGYLRLESAVNNSLSGLSVQSAGYSAGNIEQENPATAGQDYYQWEVSGTIDQYIFDNGGLELSNSMNVAPGASGSPVFYTQDEIVYFTGVLSGNLGDTPVAAAIDQDSYNWILGIIQQDGYYADYTLA